MKYFTAVIIAHFQTTSFPIFGFPHMYERIRMANSTELTQIHDLGLIELGI